MKAKSQPSVDKPGTKWRKDLLYWAVVEHYRTWLNFDGIELKQVAANKGILDGATVRRVAKEYKVNRGIRKAPVKGGPDKYANAIARGISKLAKNNWPTSLAARSTTCAAFALAVKKNYTNGEQVSAVTKLVWFVRPKGWTLFDSHVSIALGLKAQSTAGTMTAYYSELTRRRFGWYAAQINKTLKGRGFPMLFGERVIDKFLWFVGAGRVTTKQQKQTCQYFLECLPYATRRRLKAAANAVANAHAKGLLK
ncbi:MAG: hypothetical protein IH626_22535 [Rhodospirillales bacterium]|nr:hypothetical protein [Rhodospirillales bacterium]